MADALSLLEVQSLEGHTDRVWSAAWAPNGSMLASCSGDKTVRVWAQEGGQEGPWVCKALLEDSHNRTIRACEWSPGGEFLATASFDATCCIWELSHGEFECVASLEGHENEVKAVAWNAAGTLLATCSRDKSVWVWEAQGAREFECVAVLQGHSQDVKSVRWHPTRDLLVSASYDDSIKVWAEEGDGDDWRCVQTLDAAAGGHTSTVWSVAFNESGSRMVTGSDDLSLILWDTSAAPESVPGGAWKQLSSSSGFHTRTVFCVDWQRAAVAPLVASGCGDDSIRLFSPEGGQWPSSLTMCYSKEKAHTTDVNSVRWHPTDPRLLASSGDDNLVKIWRLEGALPAA